MGKTQRVTRTCELNNKLGLHARPASLLASKANEFGADVFISHPDSDGHVNAKSVMEIMMLAAQNGTTLHLTAHGKDAEEAMDAIEKLLREQLENT